VRVSVGGSEVPTYVIRRSPMGDWGFVVVSCWGLFSLHKMLPPEAAGRVMGDKRLALRGGALAWSRPLQCRNTGTAVAGGGMVVRRSHR